MKILFVTGIYPHDSVELLKELSGNRLQSAANAFQWSVVEGLMDNGYDFEVVSFPFLPSYPMRYSSLYTPSAPIIYRDKHIGSMMSYCALAGYKNISIEHRLYSYVTRWIEANESRYSKLLILTYTPHYAFVNAVKDAVKRCASNKVVVGSIVTDLVDDMLSFASNRGVLKRLQCRLSKSKTLAAYKHIDKFVILTKAMEENIPEAKGKSVVVEGLAQHAVLEPKRSCSGHEKVFLYTGALDEFTCVKDLIEAFTLIKSPEYRLIICGVGGLSSYVKRMSQEDSRIEFRGVVPREECLTLQREATCLVNPRKPNGDITKFSIPSKTMEYMSSGTPMIGYQLEGIPSEYYEHMYTPSDLTNEALAQTMEYVASVGQAVLNDKAKAAYEFLSTNKTAKAQVRKIVEFLAQSK
jgi:glycosyltransferase involved in cell wall biosynthesis